MGRRRRRKCGYEEEEGGLIVIDLKTWCWIWCRIRGKNLISALIHFTSAQYPAKNWANQWMSLWRHAVSFVLWTNVLCQSYGMSVLCPCISQKCDLSLCMHQVLMRLSAARMMHLLPMLLLPVLLTCYQVPECYQWWPACKWALCAHGLSAVSNVIFTLEI